MIDLVTALVVASACPEAQVLNVSIGLARRYTIWRCVAADIVS